MTNCSSETPLTRIHCLYPYVNWAAKAVNCVYLIDGPFNLICIVPRFEMGAIASAAAATGIGNFVLEYILFNL